MALSSDYPCMDAYLTATRKRKHDWATHTPAKYKESNISTNPSKSVRHKCIHETTAGEKKIREVLNFKTKKSFDHSPYDFQGHISVLARGKSDTPIVPIISGPPDAVGNVKTKSDIANNDKHEVDLNISCDTHRGLQSHGGNKKTPHEISFDLQTKISAKQIDFRSSRIDHDGMFARSLAPKKRTPYLCVQLIFVLASLLILFPLVSLAVNTDLRDGCKHSRLDFLSMDREKAFTILLDLHADICPLFELKSSGGPKSVHKRFTSQRLTPNIRKSYRLRKMFLNPQKMRSHNYQSGVTENKLSSSMSTYSLKVGYIENKNIPGNNTINESSQNQSARLTFNRKCNFDSSFERFTTFHQHGQQVNIESCTKLDKSPKAHLKDENLQVSRANPKPVDQAMELMNFYVPTKGENWYRNDNWGSNNPICTWFGVTCSTSCVPMDIASNTCPVIGLSLSSNNLMGTVPSINLPNLQSLVLSHNNLSGAIPSLTMSSITEVDLSFNQLNGGMPNLSPGNLLKLDISNNQLSGPMPNILILPNLIKFSASNNHFMGTLPTFECPNIEELYLDGNQLDGEIMVLDMPKLVAIYLNNNLLGGSLPDFTMAVLRELYLEHNKLHGTLPELQTPSLQVLYVSHNILSGGIGSLNSLSVLELDLSYNQLNGTFPDITMNSVRVLLLNNNKLIGEIVSLQIPEIECLDLSNNLMTGSIPIFNSSRIKSLNFSYNNFSEDIPYFATPLLRKLDLSCNQLSGPIKDLTLPQLESLLLNDNQLDGQIPNLDLQTLQEIYLDGNTLSGTLPSFPTMKLVEEFCTSNNALQGSVPNFDMPLMVVFDMGNNRLTGTIPRLQMSSMEKLDLSNNSIIGTIPELDMPSLKTLNMARNLLQGDIPYFNMELLEYLDLGTNNLRGSIPYFQMNSLLALDLSNNHLSGTIPNFNMTRLNTLNLSNNALNGTIPNFDMNFMELLHLYNNQLEGSLPEFNMPSLRELNLCDNKLSGTLPNFNMPELEQIYLHNNKINGTIPNFDMQYLQEMSLFNNKLSGSIPDFDMTLLQDLCLYGNSLTGTLPIFDMPKLIYFQLNDNQISGSIPNYQMPYITVFDVSCNMLDGTLPSLIMPNIKVFSISRNNIRGTVPSLSFPLIERLDLSDNGLEGIITNFNTPRIMSLNLSSNKFMGASPNFQAMKKLELIGLENNLLWYPLEVLEQIYQKMNGKNWVIHNCTSCNKWLTQIPICDWFGISCDLNCPKILVQKNFCPVIGLSLPSNNLKGDIATAGLEKLEWLKYLDLSANYIFGQLPSYQFLDLEQFYLNNNQLSGLLPMMYTPKLIWLNLYRNQLTGPIPNFQMPNLVWLNLYDNQLGGTIPDFDLPSLQQLDLNSNQITGTIPNFSKLTGLLLIYLDNNELYGTMPSFDQCKNLLILSASNNKLTGLSLISDSILLQTLVVSNNSISGVLPDFDNYFLTELDISFNQLNSSLPSWSLLVNLRKLDLFGNEQLVGPLPSGTDKYVNLGTLSITNTMMEIESTTKLLPSTLGFSDAYQIQNTGDTYQCPVVYNPGAAHSLMQVSSEYYKHIACKCLPGYFGFGNKCVLCPPDCDCRDGSSLKKCFYSPNDLTSIKNIIPCFNPNVCDFSIPSNSSTRVEIFNNGFEMRCPRGYQGRACSKCTEGYSKKGSVCEKCDNASTTITLLLFLLILIGFVCLYLKTDLFVDSLEENSSKKSAGISIFLFHTQVIQVISSVFRVSSATTTTETSSSLFSLKIPGIECFIGNRVDKITALNTIRAPGIVLFGLSIYLWLRKHRLDRRKKIIAFSFTFLETCYFSVTADVLSAYGCTLEDRGEEKKYLSYYPWMQCSPLNQEYNQLLASTVPGLIFLLAYPILLVYISRRAWDWEEKAPLTEPKIIPAFPGEKVVIHVHPSEGDKPCDNPTAPGCNSLENTHPGITTQMSTHETAKFDRVNSLQEQECATKPNGNVCPDIHIDMKDSGASSSAVQSPSTAGINRTCQENMQKNIQRSGESQKVSNPSDSSMPSVWDDIIITQSKSIAGIYSQRCYWWVFVRLVQSLLFGLSIRVVPYTSSTALYFTLFAWIQISIYLQVKFEPFEKEADGNLSLLSLNVLYMSFFGALIIQLVSYQEWISVVIGLLNGLFFAYFVRVFIFPIIKSKIYPQTEEPVK